MIGTNSWETLCKSFVYSSRYPSSHICPIDIAPKRIANIENSDEQMVSKVKVNVPASLLFLFLVQQSLQSLQFLNQAELSVEVARVKAETVFSIQCHLDLNPWTDMWPGCIAAWINMQVNSSQSMRIEFWAKKILDYSIPE